MAGRARKARLQRASFLPFGIGHTKPHHFFEIARTAWRNKRAPLYTWRILRDGVCDGCALGTKGLRDFTMDGVHLCVVRLNLLPLNTMGALDPRNLEEVSGLRHTSSRALRDMGRLPYPMMRRRGQPGFRRITWDQALDLAASRIRATTADRIAFYLTSRGVTNETYYVAAKAARFLGTNNVDYSSRICHAPSMMGLKQTVGVSAATCSYSDWIGTDLIVFFGSDAPNNQPVTTKYLYYAKEQGTRIVVVNPFREPGMERYWVPSVLDSAMFGTRLADAFFQIHTGGDVAFINGILKHLIENGWIDEAFVAEHTAGFEDLRAALDEQPWDLLERQSGATRNGMLDFARMYAQASSAIFVWSMGITQHRFGVDNVKAIVNLALARGMVGRERCGLVPIRGHSGVQGGAEVGAVPSQYAMGFPVGEDSATRFESLWGFRPPTSSGLTAVGMIDAAHAGRIDVLYAAGGNFLETLPEPGYVAEALGRVPLRIHQDLVVTTPMLIDPADVVLLFPARTRYEQEGGGTETSTERRIYFSPEIPGRRIGESRTEWHIFRDLAERVRPEDRRLIHMSGADAVREEIARVVPEYEGIQRLRGKEDTVQWGGPRLCEGGRFPTAEGRAQFSVLRPPNVDLPDGWYFLSTRRGKQFNSMIQGDRDPLIGAGRFDVLMNAEDAAACGLREGNSVILTNEIGVFRGRCRIVSIRPRNIQVYWPEGNILVRRGIVDPVCEMPDYNALVQVRPDPSGGRL